MSVQDKIERILKSIHLLFSKSEPYEGSGTKIIVEKQIVFELLEQLNLAFYEAMDQYEITTRKHEIAQRRCEKRGEEILQKASRHADDIYAASIMYTDDAINRICYIMDDANQAVQSIFRKMNTEIEEQRDRGRHNQLELTGQLRDFADTDKYVKLIEEVNRQREKERQMELEGRKEKKIQNEGKSYSAVKPEIKINQAYFERTGKSYESAQQGADSQSDAADSLAHITGKEAKRNRGNQIKIEDMSLDSERTVKRETTMAEREKGLDDILAKAGAGLAAMVESEIQEMENAAKTGGSALSSRPELSMETAEIPKLPPEIHVDLDAEYFKWKEGEENPVPEKKEKRFLFGRKQ